MIQIGSKLGTTRWKGTQGENLVASWKVILVALTPWFLYIGGAQLIEAMKGKVQSVLRPKRHHDEYLLRFLKARGMDVEKASDMFITSMVRGRS